MAKDEITLSRREHRALEAAYVAILGHHTNKPGKRSVFDETHDAERHEDEGFTIHDCPHCSVITHAQNGLALIRQKRTEAATPAPEPALPPPAPAVRVRAKGAKAVDIVKGPE